MAQIPVPEAASRTPLRVNVLSYEPAGGWILYDYARRLAEHLRPWVADVALTHEQRPGYDVTFHVNYAGLRQIRVPGLHSTMVTHIDTPEKFALVRAQAQAGVWGLCMSDDTTRRMTQLGGVARFLNFAPPAMSEAPRHALTVLVSGRLYDDGRKNEAWVLDFFRAFAPGELRIRVMGAGWEAQLAALAVAGHDVAHCPEFDRARYSEWLGEADHLLYTGFDEGALSTLDALIHGVVPIVTAQGYHLEQTGQMLLYTTREQLLQIAARLRADVAAENERRQRMTDWTTFARRHAVTWQRLVQALAAPPAAPAQPEACPAAQVAREPADAATAG